MKKHIPNFITCCNLFCGVVGIVFAFEGDFYMAAYFTIASLVLDFFDGFAARILKVSSPIGKELDSLADMVTFGVLPGIIMFQMMKAAACAPGVCTGLLSNNYFPYLAFLIPVFSGLRLAKFNVDTRQSDSFIGLPTPANAIFIASLPIIMDNQELAATWLANPKVLGIVTTVMSYLLVAELPLLALKFKDFSLANNKARYALIVGSLALLIGLKFAAVPFIILFYVLLSVLNTKRTANS